jgi:hypothetical protein
VAQSRDSTLNFSLVFSSSRECRTEIVIAM